MEVLWYVGSQLIDKALFSSLRAHEINKFIQDNALHHRYSDCIYLLVLLREVWILEKKDMVYLGIKFTVDDIIIFIFPFVFRLVGEFTITILRLDEVSCVYLHLSYFIKHKTTLDKCIFKSLKSSTISFRNIDT